MVLILNAKRSFYYSLNFRSSPPRVFLRKGVLKVCSKFTGEYPCPSVISLKLQSNFTKITLRHGCSPINCIFSETLFTKTSMEGCLWNLNFPFKFCKNFQSFLAIIPRWHVLFQSHQWKPQKNVWNLFKINNKSPRTASLTSF